LVSANELSVDHHANVLRYDIHQRHCFCNVESGISYWPRVNDELKKIYNSGKSKAEIKKQVSTPVCEFVSYISLKMRIFFSRMFAKFLKDDTEIYKEDEEGSFENEEITGGNEGEEEEEEATGGVDDEDL
jgi:hypothetical protein